MKELLLNIIKKIDPPDIRKFYKLHRDIVHLLVHSSVKAGDGHSDMEVTAEDGRRIPVRVYSPGLISQRERILIFFHGGGWVIDDIDRYHKVCTQLAVITDSYVVSVDYRLAPENKYPAGLDDCCEVIKQVYKYSKSRGISSHDIVLIGDSAGANLAAAASNKLRDKKILRVHRQILIYPVIDCEFEENSPYKSVHENAKGCILTAERMRGYLDLYLDDISQKDDPYVAPMKTKNFSCMPRTLIITAENDPLRDEGEEYGRRIYNAEGRVMAFRIKDGYHGFFATDLYRHPHARKAVSMIMYFLRLTD